MDSENPSAETNEEHYRYDDSIVRLFIGATAIWGLVASLAVAASIYILLNPGLIAAEYNFARFGNLPLSLTVYGFAANALFAGIYFSTQRLCKCEMWNRSLSWLHFFGWQFVNVWALVTIFYGHTEHRFGQDWVWVVDAGFALVMLCFATNLMMTLLRRRQRHMYISLWFYMSGALAPPMFQLLCNLAIPGEGYAGDSLFWGVADGFLQHWGFECIQYYMLLMPAIGLMYYFVPKATGKPVVHYRMAILQFWAMNTLGVFAATRVLHYSAVPEWITSLAMLAGVVMFFPSWGGVMAGWSMLRGPNKELLKSPILQFYLFGLIFFGFVCIEIGLTSIKSISSWTVFTDWGVAHSYAISFGVAGMFGIGAIFWMIPQLFHRALFNKNMLRINVFVSGIGAGVLVDASFLAGAIQGYKNTSIDATGTLNYEFVEILASVKPLWWAAMAGALIFAVGVLLMLVNFAATWILRDRKFSQRTTLAPRLSKDYEGEAAPKSVLEGEAVLALGVKIDKWRTLAFHRLWERSPETFAILVKGGVAFGILLQFLPIWAASIGSSEESAARPYTPLELVGRSIYIREGCANCHTQTVRPLLGEGDRYGDFTVAEQFYFDHPTQWSSRRIGPDLGRESGTRDAYWHWEHLQDPQSKEEESVMPSFAHLLDNDLKLDAIRELLRHEVSLGVTYDEKLLAEDELSVEDRLYGEVTELEQELQRQAEIVAADMVTAGGPAAKFGKEATALIAYLQRLGAAPE